ncbi:MAG: phosphonate metabolism protein/1,5-bisphosphokinase (PRPP-forming) PhnN [Acidovorax soli]|uniref:phosphonate metabolism protein/1,5-bisphosphokinase (PRPP-forming) PhnN n=1 Tax=Acidovorax soli TaxID=592050 RepID=UPI0026E9E727|nr:phosphonate metabolism protein/1,5-bisphosphokinase (PRPP-forming) PhnN [Acidovorax soli]MCM2346751.1 phosphonate metabolism protein/1,5-bisphosphokinase (PRPP-forming) PhnN [Acidovorax soli]
MTGRLVYCMGPSGAGKDSLFDWLRQHLPESSRVHWARRTISRTAPAGGEAHESVDESTFRQLRDTQTFALHWEANGLHYGVRHAELAPLARHTWVLVNGSRAYLPQALQHYPQLVAVHITASPDMLRQRLTARGRESAEQIEARVRRAVAFQPTPHAAAVQVHNDTTLDHAGSTLLHALRQLPGWPA